MEELANKISQWIKGQVGAAGCRGVVVGMSGGIDSAVVAGLSKMVFPDTTLGVIMPCHSSERDMKDALDAARALMVPTQTVLLDSAYDSLLNALPQQQANPEALRLARANIKPRLRMTTLYYIAGTLGYLVAGTGNRCELTVGYFTKWGDGGVDILPIGNLVKGQVRDLARYLHIPRHIIDKAPTAGLWEGQTDEGELGMTYAELDAYLITGGGRPEVCRRVQSLNAASAHKRRLPPMPD